MLSRISFMVALAFTAACSGGGDSGGGSGGGAGGAGGGSAGSGGGGEGCEGQATGVSCDWDSDCNSNNCYADECYGTAAGNPCDWDSDCDSNNCYDECCQPEDVTPIDDSPAECEAVIDRLADCGIVRASDVATFKTALCASGQVDPGERDLLISCVNTAQTCEETEGCAGTSGPCTTDADCDQTPGVATHEICDAAMNSYCRQGCRDDDDCVTVTCDTFLDRCNPF